MENDTKLIKESKKGMARDYEAKKKNLAGRSTLTGKPMSKKQQAKRDQDGHDYDNTK